jgi:hypothetical protein
MISKAARLVAMALIASTFLIAGCGLFGGDRNTANETLIAAPVSPISDVPIPAGFSLIKKESTSKEVQSTRVRFVDHRYSGGDDYLPVVQFYRDQMPQRGWTLVDQSQLRHETTLRFSKDNEDCVITVFARTLTTHIRVRIDPAGRNSAR